MHQDAPVRQSLFPVPPDEDKHPPDAGKVLEAEEDDPYQVDAYRRFLPSDPRNRFRSSRFRMEFSQHQQAFQVRYRAVQCRRFAHGNLYRGQKERQDHGAQ